MKLSKFQDITSKINNYDYTYWPSFDICEYHKYPYIDHHLKNIKNVDKYKLYEIRIHTDIIPLNWFIS